MTGAEMGDNFQCTKCEKSLVGQRYILNSEKPYCIDCYDANFTNTCAACGERITSASKDLSFQDRHWHEACFVCMECKTSLADRPFATKEEAIFCPDCFDEKFAARCDGCGKTFKAAMRKYEYKGGAWHEECFLCAECHQPIGAKSFIPRGNDIICVQCYEDKFAQKCVKCQAVINKGGITYKGQPWHKECFLCANCNNQLAGQKFTSKDDKIYCANCYSELFAKRCSACSKPISGFGGCKFITFEDKNWHSECFNCSKCNSSLVGRGFLVEDGAVVCPDCSA
ncbi:hypothetical protein Aperf_G00000011958 [Anoplocephala perfoliata]